MKILYVIHDFLPKHQAGAEIYTYLLAKELSQRHEVCLFFTEINILSKSYTVTRRIVNELQCIEVFRPPETDKAGVSCRDVKMEEIFTSLLVDFQPDVIHLQHLLYHSLRYPHIAKQFNIPIICTLHDYWLTCPRWGQRLRKNMEICYTVDLKKCADCIYERQEIRDTFTLSSLLHLLREKCTARGVFKNKAELSSISAQTKLMPLGYKTELLMQRNTEVFMAIDHIDLFIAPSPFLRATFIDFGVPENKIIFSDYGFDTGRYTRKEKRDTSLLRFGFIGTINEHKGVHVLVEAFNSLPKEKAELHIYGDLSWFPGYSTKLKKMATSPAIFFKGPIPNNIVAAVLADIDILVVPSIWFENSPLTIHEAFLAGVPVITSNIGGMADLITDHTNGLLFDVNDSKSLSGAIKELIESDTLLDQLRQGIPPVKSIEENGRELENLYKQLLG